MNKENCALKFVDEIILYYDARSKKHQRNYYRSYSIVDSGRPTKRVVASINLPSLVKHI